MIGQHRSIPQQGCISLMCVRGAAVQAKERKMCTVQQFYTFLTDEQESRIQVINDESKCSWKSSHAKLSAYSTQNTR